MPQQPVIVFRICRTAPARDLNVFATAAQPGDRASQEIWDNFMGSPSVYFVFAVPQDGVAAPADFNASASGYLRNIWNGTATGTGAGTLTRPLTPTVTTPSRSPAFRSRQRRHADRGVGYSLQRDQHAAADADQP